MINSQTSVTGYTSRYSSLIPLSIKYKFLEAKRKENIFRDEKDQSGILILVFSLVLMIIVMVFAAAFFLASSQTNKVKTYLSESVKEINNLNSVEYFNLDTLHRDEVTSKLQATVKSKSSLLPNVNRDTEYFNSTRESFYNNFIQIQQKILSTCKAEICSLIDFRNEINSLKNNFNALIKQSQNLAENYRMDDIAFVGVGV